MRFHPAKFRLGDGLSLTGRAMRVGGIVQYEDADAAPVTRYLLAEAAGAPAVLEESAQGFALLGTFPAKRAAGGERQLRLGAGREVRAARPAQAQAGRDRRSAAGGRAEGRPAAERGVRGLDGLGCSRDGPRCRNTDVFLLKRLPVEDVLSNEDIAVRLEAGRRAAELQAAADEEEPRTRTTSAHDGDCRCRGHRRCRARLLLRQRRRRYCGARPAFRPWRGWNRRQQVSR